MAAFRESPQMQAQLRAGFLRLLRFYGLKYSAERIEKAENWDERKVDWFLVDTHNNLRITRILKCLRSLGMEKDTRAFHDALTELCASEPDCGISDSARRYWRSALEG